MQASFLSAPAMVMDVPLPLLRIRPSIALALARAYMALTLALSLPARGDPGMVEPGAAGMGGLDEGFHALRWKGRYCVEGGATLQRPGEQ